MWYQSFILNLDSEFALIHYYTTKSNYIRKLFDVTGKRFLRSEVNVVSCMLISDVPEPYYWILVRAIPSIWR
jgi:hypothetical protein